MLIKACLNGGTTRDEHPCVPQTPTELAAEAAAADRAGAGAVRVASGNGELVEAAVRLAAELSGSS